MITLSVKIFAFIGISQFVFPFNSVTFNLNSYVAGVSLSSSSSLIIIISYSLFIIIGQSTESVSVIISPFRSCTV